MSPEVMAIVRDTRGEENHADELLNVDNLTLRLERTVTRIMQQRAGMRVPPMPLEFPKHNYNLADQLIQALGDLGHTACVDELFKLRGTDYNAEATRALMKLAPERLTNDLLATVSDKQTDSYLRQQALVTLCNVRSTNCVRKLIPLLDEVTPIEYSRPMPGPQTRICDCAAQTIAILLGWESRMSGFMRPDLREQNITRAREWANSTSK